MTFPVEFHLKTIEGEIYVKVQYGNDVYTYTLTFPDKDRHTFNVIKGTKYNEMHSVDLEVYEIQAMSELAKIEANS